MSTRVPHIVSSAEEAENLGRRMGPRRQMAGTMVGRMLGANGIESGRLLEIGTGGGELAIQVAKALPRVHVYAVDRSEAFLELARKQPALQELGDRVHLQHIGGDELPFADDHFEVVVGVGMFLTADDPSVLLREIDRVLSPTGKLMLNVPIRRIETAFHPAMRAAVSMGELRSAIKGSKFRSCRFFMRNRRSAILTNLGRPGGPGGRGPGGPGGGGMRMGMG
jgi:ubiquinone/menaquinone biosynthesis C-methylase UbiE